MKNAPHQDFEGNLESGSPPEPISSSEEGEAKVIEKSVSLNPIAESEDPISADEKGFLKIHGQNNAIFPSTRASAEASTGFKRKSSWDMITGGVSADERKSVSERSAEAPKDDWQAVNGSEQPDFVLLSNNPQFSSDGSPFTFIGSRTSRNLAVNTVLSPSHFEAHESTPRRRLDSEAMVRDCLRGRKESEEGELEVKERQSPLRKKERNKEAVIGFLVGADPEFRSSYCPIRVGRLIIGSLEARQSEQSFYIEHESVSESHATLRACADGALHVLDQFSDKGTWIRKAGKEETPATGGAIELTSGDTIRFGEVRFVVCGVPNAKDSQDTEDTE